MPADMVNICAKFH